jgi:hypothetical protein
MTECRFCGSKALTLWKGAPTNKEPWVTLGYDADFSCGDCGEWQKAIVDSVRGIVVGYNDRELICLVKGLPHKKEEMIRWFMERMDRVPDGARMEMNLELVYFED